MEASRRQTHKRLASVMIGILFSAIVHADDLYWASESGDVICRSDLDGTNRSCPIGNTSSQGIQIDPVNETIYWTDIFSKYVLRSVIGSDVIEPLVNLPGQGRGLALNRDTGQMYFSFWGGGTGLGYSSLDGSDPTFFSGGSQPLFVTLDKHRQKIYWSNTNAGTIIRADLDGANQETVLSGLFNPWGVAVSLGGNIFWTEGSSGVIPAIKRSDLNGDNVEVVLTDLVRSPRGLVLDEIHGHLYWADYNGGFIGRVNIDGSGPIAILSTGRPSAVTIVIETLFSDGFESPN